MNTPAALPPLREDLQLLDGPVDLDGAPSWSIFDPVRSSYFRISWAAFQMLSRWQTGDPQVLLSRVRRETTCKPSEAS